MPCEDEGRGNGDAVKGMPKIDSKPQKLVKRHGTHSPSALRRNQPVLTGF